MVQRKTISDGNEPTKKVVAVYDPKHGVSYSVICVQCSETISFGYPSRKIAESSKTIMIPCLCANSG
jgi:hypothetical protein